MRMLELKCLASRGLEHCRAKNGNYFNIFVWHINQHHDYTFSKPEPNVIGFSQRFLLTANQYLFYVFCYLGVFTSKKKLDNGGAGKYNGKKVNGEYSSH